MTYQCPNLDTDRQTDRQTDRYPYLESLLRSQHRVVGTDLLGSNHEADLILRGETKV